MALPREVRDELRRRAGDEGVPMGYFLASQLGVPVERRQPVPPPGRPGEREAAARRRAAEPCACGKAGALRYAKGPAHALTCAAWRAK